MSMSAHRFRPVAVAGLAAVLLASFVVEADRATLAAAQGGIDAQFYAPNQAVVFDGSAEASLTYVLALSEEGLLEQVPSTPIGCGQGAQPVQWAIQPFGEPGKGASIPETFLFDAGFFARPPGPTSSPFDPTALTDDCAVLAVFAQVQQYLADMRARAEHVQVEIDQCLGKVRALHCQVENALQDAPVIAGSPSGFEAAATSDTIATGGAAICNGCAHGLAELPQRIDFLEHQAETCRAQFGGLSRTLDTIAKEVVIRGGLSSGRKEDLRERADVSVALAEEASFQASEGLGALGAVELACTLERVTVSCTLCSGGGPAGTSESRSVLAAWSRQPIGRLVGAFNAAAAQAGSLELSTRLSNLAFRLARLPNHRVLHVTFRSTSLISQDLVALAPPPADGADDGKAPLAIVLTVLDRYAPLPDMTSADQRLLFDTMRAFYDLVVRQGK